LERRLFGTSGIRGSIAEKVSVDLALDLGRGLGTFLNGKGTVAVGTDARTSRQVLRNAFVSGLLSTGVSVMDLSIAPMPAVAAQSAWTRVSASVIITASHNPATDNGFKFFTGGREFIRSEEQALEKCIFGHDFSVASWTSIGSIVKTDIKQAYLRKIRKFLGSRGGEVGHTKVLVDTANGAASGYTPELLRELGFTVTTINSHPDGYFPGRLPEPSPTNLVDTMKVGAGSDFAATFCHDGDGDRLAVIDEKGRFVDQNRVIALFAKDEVKRKGGGLVVTSIDTSSVIDEVVGKAGGEVSRVPLGSLQEQLAKDRQQSIVFASEPWKAIFTDLGCWMDGIAAAGRFAQMVREVGQDSCIRLMSLIPEYPVLRDQVTCPDNMKQNFMANVRSILLSEITGIQRVLDIDGIRIECTDGSYLLVRPSGTEPKARVYIGARTQASLDKLAAIAMDAIQRALDYSTVHKTTS
jgi:phosphomannomutase